MSLYRKLVRPLLFRLPAETAHHATLTACRVGGRVPGLPGLMGRLFETSAPNLETELAGIRLKSPIGLAAGWDKSGQALRMIDRLGFGFAEIGSISARPSRGNPRPRLFRLPEDQAIVVNYGLPNDGAETVSRRLRSADRTIPLGINLVKTNDGPDAAPCDEAQILWDYHASVAALHRQADYLTLNLSCPNAAGGKDHFAQPGSIRRLLCRLAEESPACPMFLKVAPDPDPANLTRLLEESDPFPFVRGFIFNLPAGKPPTLSLRTPRSRWSHLPGAVSGRPVSALIDDCIARLYRLAAPGRYQIIGVGGIFSAEDAWNKIRLGASAVQIYTALVYEGPGVIPRIHRGLAERLEREGFRSIAQAVGTATRRP